jgi:hypothetical protein
MIRFNSLAAISGFSSKGGALVERWYAAKKTLDPARKM